MATNTTRLGLIKPDYVDVVDIADLNSNADDIDAAVGYTICTSTTRPSTPWTGQAIFETDTLTPYVWDGSAWQVAGGGGSIEISATAPSSPQDGDLWWDSDNGNLYIYYDDGTSQQWVAANGPQVFVGTAAPAGYQGQLWFDSTQGKTYIYYDDGTSAQWVSAIGGSLSGNVIQVVSTTKTDTFTSSSTTPVDITGASVSITPRSTSSKIYVMFTFAVGLASAQGVAIQLFRNSTNIGGGAANGSRLSAINVATVGGANYRSQESGFFLDSPNTTSTITYKLQGWSEGGAWYVGRSSGDTDSASAAHVRTPLTITAMEIAG